MLRPARRPSLPTSLLAALALVLAVAATGCITPSIPIPPPDPERMAFDVDLAEGSARFSYPAEANYSGAIVYVFNRTDEVQQGIITVARDDGSVGPTEPFPVAAGIANDILVSFETEDQVVSTCVTVRDGAAAGICF